MPGRERKREQRGVRNSRGNTKVRGVEEVLQALDQRLCRLQKRPCRSEVKHDKGGGAEGNL